MIKSCSSGKYSLTLVVDSQTASVDSFWCRGPAALLQLPTGQLSSPPCLLGWARPTNQGSWFQWFVSRILFFQPWFKSHDHSQGLKSRVLPFDSAPKQHPLTFKQSLHLSVFLPLHPTITAEQDSKIHKPEAQNYSWPGGSIPPFSGGEPRPQTSGFWAKLLNFSWVVKYFCLKRTEKYFSFGGFIFSFFTNHFIMLYSNESEALSKTAHMYIYMRLISYWVN